MWNLSALSQELSFEQVHWRKIFCNIIHICLNFQIMTTTICWVDECDVCARTCQAFVFSDGVMEVYRNPNCRSLVIILVRWLSDPWPQKSKVLLNIIWKCNIRGIALRTCSYESPMWYFRRNKKSFINIWWLVSILTQKTKTSIAFYQNSFGHYIRSIFGETTCNMYNALILA